MSMETDQLRRAAASVFVVAVILAATPLAPRWAAAGETSDASRALLWYRRPAVGWREALPVGNGRLGAMVLGKTDRERIQLNDDALWAGGPKDRHNPKALEALPQVRRLLFADKHEEAARLAEKTMLGVPCTIESYQTLGDLWLEVPGHGDVSDYRRELDLDSGIVRVSYTSGGAHFAREVFATAVDQVLAVRFTCDRPGRITCKVTLTRPQEAQTKPLGPDLLVLRGACNGGKGMKFAALVKAIPTGGKVTAGDQALAIQAADGLTLLIASATTYRTADPEAACTNRLKTAAAKPYDSLRADHVRDHRVLFRRVRLDLGPPADNTIPTDERLAAFRRGADDPQLAALFFQFGRYLLLASSRPGSLPANLQGIWNEDIEAAWNADFHANINLQMNYWPAEACNLAECHLPLVDLTESLVKPGSETARRHYGARGWVLHHLTDPWASPCRPTGCGGCGRWVGPGCASTPGNTIATAATGSSSPSGRIP